MKSQTRNPAELLSTITVRQLLDDENGNKKAPIYIEATASVEDGCKILNSGNISSAPLYDAPSDTFIGLIDFRDFAVYVLKVFHKISSENKFDVDAEMGLSDIVRLSNFDKQGVPVHLISNLSMRNALVSIDSSALVLDACKLMIREKVRRLVIFDSTIPKGPERFVGVLSESNICKFVADRFGILGGNKKLEGVKWDNGGKSIAELGFVKGNVTSIQKEDSVLDALRLMHEHGISSLAIVEEINKLIGTISITDLREIVNSRRNWKHLYDQVFMFFQNTVSKLGIERGADRVPSIVVRPSTSLITTMERMAGTNVHRLWIVDNGNSIEGVFSMSDLMPLLILPE